MFLSCKPVVTIINEDYEILLCTKENGIISIEINGEIYREENSGVLYSEKNYAKIRVPQKVLDKSKKYTVVFNKILNRTAYFSKLGEAESMSFRFKPVKKRGEINAYHLADIHGCFEEAKMAASYFGNKLDLLMLNGDYCEFGGDEDYLRFLSFVGDLTGGRIPVILVRGNHDCRGKASEKYTDRLTANGKNTYYTFTAGRLKGIVLDFGEDKPDENKEYGGVNDFYYFRKRELDFLKSLKPSKCKPLFAIGHTSPGYNTSHKGDPDFDIEQELFAECNKELERLGIKFYIMGHFHRSAFLEKNDHRSNRPHSYPIIVGSECVKPTGDYSGTALTFNGDKLTVRITGTKKDLKKDCLIDLKSGEICE